LELQRCLYRTIVHNSGLYAAVYSHGIHDEAWKYNNEKVKDNFVMACFKGALNHSMGDFLSLGHDNLVHNHKLVLLTEKAKEIFFECAESENWRFGPETQYKGFSQQN